MNKVSSKTANAVEVLISKLENERRQNLTDVNDDLDEEKVKELVRAFYKDQGLSVDENKIDFFLKDFKKDTLPQSFKEESSVISSSPNSLFVFTPPKILACIFKEKWNQNLEKLIWEHKPYSFEDVEASYQANLSKMKIWKFKIMALFCSIGVCFTALLVSTILLPSPILIFMLMNAIVVNLFLRNWFKKVICDWRLMRLSAARKDVAKQLLMVPLYRHIFKFYSTNGGRDCTNILERFDDMFELFNKCDWKQISGYDYNFRKDKNASKIMKLWEKESNPKAPVRNIDCFLLNQYCLNQLEKSDECKMIRKDWVDLNA